MNITGELQSMLGRVQLCSLRLDQSPWLLRILSKEIWVIKGEYLGDYSEEKTYVDQVRCNAPQRLKILSMLLNKPNSLSYKMD